MKEAPAAPAASRHRAARSRLGGAVLLQRSFGRQQRRYFLLQLRQVAHHDAPHQFIRYRVVAVDDAVAGSHNLAGMRELERRVEFQDAAHGFAHDFEVALRGAAGAYVLLIAGEIQGLAGKEAFGFFDGLQHVVQAGADFRLHTGAAG